MSELALANSLIASEYTSKPIHTQISVHLRERPLQGFFVDSSF